MMDRNGVRMRIGGYMCYSCKKEFSETFHLKNEIKYP